VKNIIFGLAILCATPLSAGVTPELMARACGLSLPSSTHRIFGSGNQATWVEYTSAEKIPEDPDSASVAQIFQGKTATLVILDSSAAGDLASTTYCCFNADAALRNLRHDLWTAWGWSYSQIAEIKNGTRKTLHSQFRSTNGGQIIARPDQANDVAEWVSPKIYEHTTDLPFASLLNNKKANAPTH
jgi:hypothetical protein